MRRPTAAWRRSPSSRTRSRCSGRPSLRPTAAPIPRRRPCSPRRFPREIFIISYGATIQTGANQLTPADALAYITGAGFSTRKVGVRTSVTTLTLSNQAPAAVHFVLPKVTGGILNFLQTSTDWRQDFRPGARDGASQGRPGEPHVEPGPLRARADLRARRHVHAVGHGVDHGHLSEVGCGSATARGGHNPPQANRARRCGGAVPASAEAQRSRSIHQAHRAVRKSAVSTTQGAMAAARRSRTHPAPGPPVGGRTPLRRSSVQIARRT